MNQNQNN